MQEKRMTARFGTRTSAVQYEHGDFCYGRSEHRTSYQPVRQGNKRYSVSPIYQQRVATGQ